MRPGASRTLVGGAWPGGGEPALVVAVTARAVDGAATEAVLAAVADAFGVSKRTVRLVSGRHSRTKVLDLTDAPEDAPVRLRELLGA